MLDIEWLKGVTTNDTHHMVVRELALEAERLRAALGKIEKFTKSRQSNNIAAVVYEVSHSALAGTEATPRRDTVKGERPGTEVTK